MFEGIRTASMPSLSDPIDQQPAPRAAAERIHALKVSDAHFARLLDEYDSVNDEVAGDPTLVNSAAEGAGWLVKVRFTEEPELLDEAAYRELTA